MISKIGRLLAGALAVLMLAMTPVFALSPSRESVTAYRESGVFSIGKLSMTEIRDLLSANDTQMPSSIYSSTPSVSAPYAAGELHQDVLNKTLNRLNALRRIAGLAPVELDPALNANAQHGAVLLAASNFSHTPDRPSDMSEAFYNEGVSATGSSNIYAGRPLTQTIDGWMNDSDSIGNLSCLGHRRWQLNPRMGKTGLGYAENPSSIYTHFACEKVFDTSATPGDHDFIAWPSSGYFPNNTRSFTNSTAWSVSPNTAKFKLADRSALQVTVTRTSDQRTWTLYGAQDYPFSDNGDYLTLDTAGYGSPLCIIFRPGGVSSYEGEYVVSISGIQTVNNEAVDFSYRVSFFDPDNIPDPSTPTPVPTPTPTPVPNPSIGDVNRDGIVSADDAVIILRYALGLLEGADLSLADVDGDGSISSTDAILALRIAIGVL